MICITRKLDENTKLHLIALASYRVVVKDFIGVHYVFIPNSLIVDQSYTEVTLFNHETYNVSGNRVVYMGSGFYEH